MVVSDHGMLDVYSPKEVKTIDIETILNASDIQVMLDRGSLSFLIPKPGKLEKVSYSLTMSITLSLNETILTPIC